LPELSRIRFGEGLHVLVTSDQQLTGVKTDPFVSRFVAGGVMDVATIEMPADQAALKLEEYRKFLHRRADAEFESIAKGLEFQAEGIPLIDLDASIRNGGFFEDGRPKLAVARADREVVRFSWNSGNIGKFYAGPFRGREYETLAVNIDFQRVSNRWIGGFTMIPIVPPDIRNKVPGELGRFHILWEVERWFDRHPKTPPVDPYLIQHVAGSLWAVLAEWDLTELERAVMGERAKSPLRM